MYCPLCKAEYRAGFERCSDCLIGLVHTYEEAKAAKVLLLWEGVRHSRFDSIVGALRDASIPNYAVSGAQPERKSSFWAYVGIIGHFIRAKEVYENMTWKVYVLESDYLNARAILENQV